MISFSRRLPSLSSIIFRRNNVSSVRQFKVTLDNETLYVEQPLAEALGWNPAQPSQSVTLTLSGWTPRYFAIARSGSDAGFCSSLDSFRHYVLTTAITSELPARGTVESANNPHVQKVLQHLKDSDAQS